ncbi:hypothetical protein ACGFJC_47535 [Nonomuraea fuscirosea]|uniref:hypothetical protein n=1 Tax=Nonomuraea fuscirosea TaxID=1291556 RepID=UPI00371E2FE5
MTAPQHPAWLAADRFPDGPHWTDCERVHPGCAWKAGVRHGHDVAAHFILDLIQPGDAGERVRALTEAARLVWRLAGPSNGDPTVLTLAQLAALEAEVAAIDADDKAEAALEAIDRAALSGACVDEAAHL